jgi:DNA-binding response OmpR family regulator
MFGFRRVGECQVASPLNLSDPLARVDSGNQGGDNMNNIRQLRQITAYRPNDGAERSLLIDRYAREVTLDGGIIELTATEFDILEYLDGNVHQVVTYREVITAVWGDAMYFDQHALEVQVSRLRAKLGESDGIYAEFFTDGVLLDS